MNSKDINGQHNLAYDLFKDLKQDDLEYVYRGLFTQNITKSILSLTETNLDKAQDTSKIKNRIYFIMTEGLQNITRHQDKSKDEVSESSSIFIIRKKNGKFYITTGNIIENNKIEHLKTMLDKINGMGKDELKKMHKEVLRSGKISDKGGAGLGLIEMARKSGNKLLFDFSKLNDVYSYFYMNTQIPTGKEKEKIVTDDDKLENNFSLVGIKELHTVLNKKNIILNFKGAFNQESLLNLLSLIEGQMSNVSTANKIFSIMVEMLQNIVRHADKGTEMGNPGIFFINIEDDKVLLTCGNYIKNNKKAELSTKIDYINNLSTDKLNDCYNKVMLGFDVDADIEIGLGFLDMRLKSEEQLNCNFYYLNEEYSFFTIQTGILLKD